MSHPTVSMSRRIGLVHFHNQMVAATQCNIFILDKEAPPGCGPDMRMVILVGTQDKVMHAHQLVSGVYEEAKASYRPPRAYGETDALAAAMGDPRLVAA